MSRCFKQLIKTKAGYFSLGIFFIAITSLLFIKTTFAMSLNSSDKIESLDVILVDELQAESFIDQLSNYNHIAIEQLSNNEAQSLLQKANSKSLMYSINYKQLTGEVLSDCVVGVLVGFMIIFVSYPLFLAPFMSKSLVDWIPPLVIGGGCIFAAIPGVIKELSP